MCLHISLKLNSPYTKMSFGSFSFKPQINAELKTLHSIWDSFSFIFILYFPTTPLITRMHLVSRLNLPAVMNAGSLVLMQTFIRSAPRWHSGTHLDLREHVKYCWLIDSVAQMKRWSSSCVSAWSRRFHAWLKSSLLLITAVRCSLRGGRSRRPQIKVTKVKYRVRSPLEDGKYLAEVLGKRWGEKKHF